MVIGISVQIIEEDINNNIFNNINDITNSKQM